VAALAASVKCGSVGRALRPAAALQLVGPRR
jgi:hypothetical protein